MASIGTKPNLAGVKLVSNPNSKIAIPVSNHPKYAALSDKMDSICSRFLDQYQEHPKGILFRYSDSVIHRETFERGLGLALKIGDAAHGISLFEESIVLTQLSQENSDTITLLDVNANWAKASKHLAAFVTPFFVDSTLDSQEKFFAELNDLYYKINHFNGPRVIYIPCIFAKQNRRHWVLIAVEKLNQRTIATYINTRGGRYESTAPKEQTLKTHENIVEVATEDNFNTSLVRNPDAPLCLTEKSCGLDIIDIAERLTEQASANNAISEFVSQGGLLQMGDLASTDPEQMDLNNRSKAAERFIAFLQSWSED